MRKRVVIAGCGNIGSRLLQSLAGVKNFSLDIVGSEPIEAAKKLSQERFEEALTGKHSLSWQDMAAYPYKNIDFLIISSDARNRFAALSAIVDKTAPQYVLLEKILFTHPRDYAKAQAKLNAVGAKTWVNASRNVWPGYRALKTRLSDTASLSFKVTGPDWNLGSNAIHFLSVVEYLTGSRFEELFFDPISDGWRDAKRDGYKEITGTLTGRTVRGDTISLNSDPSVKHPICIELNAGTQNYRIDEAQQSMAVNGDKIKFPMLHASQLETVFEDILNYGKSDLPTLSESTHLHLMFFNAIAPALGLVPGDEIPVT